MTEVELDQDEVKQLPAAVLRDTVLVDSVSVPPKLSPVTVTDDDPDNTRFVLMDESTGVSKLKPEGMVPLSAPTVSTTALENPTEVL